MSSNTRSRASIALALGIGFASMTGGAATAAPEPSVPTSTETGRSADRAQEAVPLEVTSPGRTYTIGEPVFLAGKATPGAFVFVNDPLVPGGATVIRIDDSGTWSWTSQPIRERAVTVRIDQRHEALGINERISVDFKGVDAEEDGTFIPLAVTSDRTYAPGRLLTVSGTATPGATIRFNDWSDPDGFWAIGRTDSDGRWTLTSSKPIRKDSVELSFLQVHDASGKSDQVVGTFSSDGTEDPFQEIRLDTPRTYRVGDEVVLRGTATPGYRISVHTLGTETVVDASGGWALPAFRATAEEYWFRVVQTMPDGSWSNVEWFSLSSRHDELRFEQTTYARGDRLSVVGDGTPGATVELLDGAATLGSTTVGEDGRWFLTTRAGIDVPRVRTTIRQTADLLGSTEVRATFVANDVHVPIEVESDLTYTPGRTVTLSGTATPRAHLRVYVGPGMVSTIGSVRVNSDGQWQISTDKWLPVYPTISLYQDHPFGNEHTEVELEPVG